MNRKKGLLLISAIEMIILLIITLLFVSHIIPVKVFIVLIILAGVLSSAAIFILIRKLNP